jgi:hypothetical protein
MKLQFSHILLLILIVLLAVPAQVAAQEEEDTLTLRLTRDFILPSHSNPPTLQHARQRPR